MKKFALHLLSMALLVTLSGCYIGTEDYPSDEVGNPSEPFVEGQSAQLVTWMNTPFTYQLTCNNNVGQPCQFSLINTPIHGTLELNSATGQVVYTPDENFVGNDAFDFQTEVNGLMADDPATITIQVNPPGHHV